MKELGILLGLPSSKEQINGEMFIEAIRKGKVVIIWQLRDHSRRQALPGHLTVESPFSLFLGGGLERIARPILNNTPDWSYGGSEGVNALHFTGSPRFTDFGNEALKKSLNKVLFEGLDYPGLSHPYSAYGKTCRASRTLVKMNMRIEGPAFRMTIKVENGGKVSIWCVLRTEGLDDLTNTKVQDNQENAPWRYATMLNPLAILSLQTGNGEISLPAKCGGAVLGDGLYSYDIDREKLSDVILNKASGETDLADLRISDLKARTRRVMEIRPGKLIQNALNSYAIDDEKRIDPFGRTTLAALRIPELRLTTTSGAACKEALMLRHQTTEEQRVEILTEALPQAKCGYFMLCLAICGFYQKENAGINSVGKGREEKHGSRFKENAIGYLFACCAFVVDALSHIKKVTTRSFCPLLPLYRPSAGEGKESNEIKSERGFCGDLCLRNALNWTCGTPILSFSMMLLSHMDEACPGGKGSKSGEKIEKTMEWNRLVATFTATLAFWAAVQVPGGYDDKGQPFLKDTSGFQVFFWAVECAFVFSLMSIVYSFCAKLSSAGERALAYSAGLFIYLALGSLALALFSGMTLAILSLGILSSPSGLMMGQLLFCLFPVVLIILVFTRSKLESD